MIKSERQLVYLDEVYRILENVLLFDHETLMIEYVRYKIGDLHTITLSEMEDKDVE